MKQKEYFPHDFHSRDHLLEIFQDYGLQGIGFYWCFVEILHERDGAVKESDVGGIAYSLRADPDMVKAIIHNYDKFQIRGKKITCHRVTENIKCREEISQKRTRAAKKRWEQSKDEPLPADSDDDEMPAQFYSEFNPDISQNITEEERRELTKEYYIALIRRKFDEYLEAAETGELFEHNIYDYKELFEAVVNEVKTKDYVVINRKNVQVWKFLQVIAKHIKKNGSIANLDEAVRDVERRYAAGKVKNKTNYLIAALYNAAILDASDIVD